MPKKTKNNNQKTILALIVGLMIGVGLTTIYFIMHPIVQTRTIKDANTSEKNLEIFQKAAHDKNVTICGQIKGGINATDNNELNKNNEYGFSIGKSTKHKEMNEEEAIASCRENTQKAIENRQN